MKSVLVSLGCAALLLAGGCGGGGGGGDTEPPPDTTAPTVGAVQAPSDTVNRTVTLTVTANDNVGVTEVRFFVDGTEIGADGSAPYSVDWDTSGETEGDHTLTAEAEDAAGNVGASADVTVTVRNIEQFDVALSGMEETPPVDTAATGQGSLTINLVTGEVAGELTVTGLDATDAHIHDAFAGSNGPVLIGLEQDAGDPSLFSVPAAAALDAGGVDRLLAGALYLNVHTDAEPAGAIRGQILPQGFVLRFAELSGRQEVPEVGTAASGRAAMTLDTESGAVAVHAQTVNLDDANQAHVHENYAGANGPVLVPLQQDPMDAGHWFVEDGELNAAGLDAFAAGRLYVNVHTPEHPGGEIRGQVLPQGIDLLLVDLSGDQEVPAVDTNATGLAALTLDQSGSLLTIHVNTARLGDASDAHLHGAYGGVNGPVEIGLTQDGGNAAHWFTEEAALTGAQLDALLAGATYVNVHSPSNPGGEIRGQVIPDGIVFAHDLLSGRQEVPAVDTQASGHAAVTVDVAAGTLVAHVNTSGVDDATAAHLHDAFAGTNGQIVIPLEQDATTASRWSAIDAPVDADQIAAIRAGRYYANVHTPANLTGEIRGQLAPPPIEVLITDMSGDQEVPPVASAGSGIAASTVNRESGEVTLHVNADGVDDATAAHIHQGYAGQNGPVLVPLEQDLVDPGHWSASAGLDDAGLGDYLDGRLYVNLHTPANPGGELRGQLAPRDIQVVFSPMDGSQVVPPVTTTAEGLAATTVNLATQRLVAFVNATGVDDATSAGIHEGAAGENGPEVLALEQTPMQLGQWSGIAEELAADAFSAYRAGRLYVQVATPAQADGEIRGQIEPPDAAEFDDQPPDVTLTSPAPGATVSDTVTLEADASDNQGVVAVRFLVDGTQIGSDATAPYSFDWDTTATENGDVTLTAEAEDAVGNVGTSGDVNVTVENAAPVTLAEIQADVFTPTCSVSGCHDGEGNVLPGVMNLTSTAESFDALVNVASIQVPSLDRVEPGDPDNSYLIHKLEGTQAEGLRMPQGGPFLDQATIDDIRQWIADGANP